MSEQPYIVSARKYRPANFKSVVGQKALTETLKNAVASGRLAQAYLFCGPRGVGKTSCARIFAKTINCLSPTADGEACGECESCRAIDQGNSFNIVELDAASNNSVDDIRSLTEQVNVPPTLGKYRVFIIDEVHMLSSQAFNAFLKTLEEPPSYVVFILATTEKHKVIPTILSRCQIYDFKRITIQDTVEHLQYVAQSEGISTDVPSLNVIAKKADGAMRDALSIFDQVAASSFGKITYESTIASLNVLDYEYYFRLVEAFRQGDVPEALMIYKEIRDHGFDSLFFINGLGNHVRDLMVAYAPQTAGLLEVADDVAKRYQEQAKSLPIDWHYAAMKLINDCDFQYRTSSNKQFLVELTLIRLCQLLNPPTPPFDRVDSDSIPLRDPANPHPSAVAPSYQPVQASQPISGTNPASVSQPASAQRPDSVSTVPTTPTSQAVSTAAVAPSPAAADGNTQKPDNHNNSSAAPETQARPVRRATRGNRGSASASFRLSEGSDSNVGTRLERAHDAVADEDFSQAWEDFIIAHPEKHILISAMRKSSPVRKDADTFLATVDHPALLQSFELEMKELIGYFRERLHNDFLSLEVEIDKNVKVVKQMPQQELLKEIIESNPVMGDFLAAIDAELT
ncbi:MAG: DNA polymerase III subunit gamma/tau [Bacteroidales bacterium]|nr:DNA polymerase III subunit gamma/tau [Bacteroidales bacterium]